MSVSSLPSRAAPLASGAIRAAAARDSRVSQTSVISGVLGFDMLAIAVAGVTAYGRWRGEAPYNAGMLLLCVCGVVLGVLVLLKSRWSYTIGALRDAPRQIGNLGLALLIAMSGVVLLGVFSGETNLALRGWIGEWFLAAWIPCSIVRAALAYQLAAWSRQGRLARRAVVVGGGDTTHELVERLDRAGASDIQLLGLFDDRDKNRSPEMVGRYCKLGRFDDLVAFCRDQQVDLLIIALPPTAEDRILYLLKKLWELPIDVRIAAIGSKLKLRSRAYNYIGDVPFLPVFDKPMSDWSVAMKAIEDRVLAGLGLLALSPVFLAVALAVKLDSRGPVFFKQKRHGFNNEPINVYKFRSMYVDQGDANAAKLVTRGDPRVTKVGAFIRRTSLDELPQLINVLKGDLSLVGPRPHAMQAKADGRIYDELVDNYFARHKVKPGITGWAQVSGWRGETDTAEKIEKRVACDLYYIENWSALFDLKILLMTPLSLVTTKNAY